MADDQSHSLRLFPCTGSAEDYMKYLEKLVEAYMEYVETFNLHGCVDVPDSRQDWGALPAFHQTLKSSLNRERSNVLEVHRQPLPTLQSREAQTISSTSPGINHPSTSLRLAERNRHGLLRNIASSGSAKGVQKAKHPSNLLPSRSSRRTWSAAETSSSRVPRSRLTGRGGMSVIVWDASTEYNVRANAKIGSKRKANEFLETIPESESQWESLVKKTNLLTAKEIAKTFRLLTLQSSSRTTTAPFCNIGDKTSQVLGKYPKLCDHLQQEASRSDVLYNFSRLMLSCIARVFRTAGLATEIVDAMVGHRSPKYERDTRHSAKDVASLIEQLEARLGCIASQLFLICCPSMKTYRDWDINTRHEVFEEVCKKVEPLALIDPTPESHLSFSPAFMIIFMGIASLDNVNEALGTNITPEDYEKRAAPYLKLEERNDDTVSPINLVSNRSAAFAPNGNHTVMLGTSEGADMGRLHVNPEWL